MKSKRELQFLTYLDALERGDAEGISAFLLLAEADAELEQMMLDHHQNENQEESPPVLSPLKRKREDVNRWWERFGMGLVATIAMILVGLAGVYIGASNSNTADALNQMLNPSQDPNALTTPNSPAAFDSLCQAEIVSEDNTIRLLAGGDMDRALTVGVNNPFLLLLNTSDRVVRTDYDAIFEGLRVIVDDESIRLHGRCDGLSSVQVLPKDDAYKTCELRVDALQLPISNPNSIVGEMTTSWVKQEALVISAPEDGYYPVISPSFEGRIPLESVHPGAGCNSFPLLYTPAFNESSNEFGLPTSTTPVIQLDALKVTEQRFERGVFFYVHAVDQLWIVFDYEEGRDKWFVSSFDASHQIPYAEAYFVPDGLFAPEAGLFESVWATTGFDGIGYRDLVRYEIGYALAEAQTYQAAYQSRLLAGGYHIHFLTSTTGDVYSLYERENHWELNSTSFRLGTSVNSTTTPDTSCRAEVASDDNTIMLLPDGDVNRSMTVGVNNPFVINPLTNRGMVGFNAFFEGLSGTVGINSINLLGDCSSMNNSISVYPRDDASKTCTIEAESLTFPFVKLIEVEDNVITRAHNRPYEQELVLLAAPVDGIYPIVDSQFVGGIPVGDIQISAGCTSFPLLFTQPSASASPFETQPITVTAFHVNEQTFEHGRLLYLPVINQVLLACENSFWTSLPPQAPTASENSPTPPEGFFAAKGNFIGLWQSLPTTPLWMSISEGGEQQNMYCDLGWATSDLLVYQAAYHYTPDERYASQGIIWNGIHSFTSSNGDVYIFNEADGSWRVED